MNYNIDEGGYGGETGYGGGYDDESMPGGRYGKKHRKVNMAASSKRRNLEGADDGSQKVRMDRKNKGKNVVASGNQRNPMERPSRRQNVEGANNRNNNKVATDGNRRVQMGDRRNARKQQGPAQVQAATLKATDEENVPSVESHTRSKRYIRLNYNIDDGGYGEGYVGGYGGGYGDDAGYGGDEYKPKRGGKRNNYRQGGDNYGGGNGDKAGYGGDEYKPKRGGKRKNYRQNGENYNDGYGGGYGDEAGYGGDEYMPKRGGRRNNYRQGGENYGGGYGDEAGYGGNEYMPKRGGRRNNYRQGGENYGATYNDAENYGATYNDAENYGATYNDAENYGESMPKKRYGRKGQYVSMGKPKREQKVEANVNGKASPPKSIVSPSGRARIDASANVKLGNQGGRQTGGRRPQQSGAPKADGVSTLSFKEALDQSIQSEQLTKLSTGNSRFLHRFENAL